MRSSATARDSGDAGFGTKGWDFHSLGNLGMKIVFESTSGRVVVYFFRGELTFISCAYATESEGIAWGQDYC